MINTTAADATTARIRKLLRETDGALSHRRIEEIITRADKAIVDVRAAYQLFLTSNGLAPAAR